DASADGRCPAGAGRARLARKRPRAPQRARESAHPERLRHRGPSSVAPAGVSIGAQTHAAAARRLAFHVRLKADATYDAAPDARTTPRSTPRPPPRRSV